MLIHGDIDENDIVKSIKDADFPVPFKSGLEFNSPAHGTWNIVHTGMLMPDARQIYVCAKNCMRGVVLTAAEMNAAERFSFVIVDERNIINGSLEQLTIDGVTDILNKLDVLPRAVLLFTVCIHHFLGCDLDWIYKELEKRFPDVIFVRCFMDPIKQKHGLTPDQKLRKAMYDPIFTQTVKKHTVALIGSDFSLEATSDICRIIKKLDYKLLDIVQCKSWEEYESLGSAEFFISCYPSANYGAKKLAERLERKYLYLPGSFNYDEIRRELENFLKHCDAGLDIINLDDFCKKEISECENVLKKTKDIIGDTSIAIDYTFHPRPLGLAKLLIEHGFNVETVYLDSISTEEKDDFEWLQINCPELKLISTIRAEMRMMDRVSDKKILAIGQKAAWFAGSKHFVNVVHGGGLWGFDGIRQTLMLMMDAFENAKDPENLIVRKGWGCESCI